VTDPYPPSPVPADQDLWPGELPFTHWGQHEYGTFDLRVFDQDVWWVDIAQQPHRLEEMGEDYIANVIAFLLNHREYYYLCTLRRSLIQVMGDSLLEQPNADLVAEQAGAPPLSALPPSTWLESTPLMRALRARARGDHRPRPS
jgi:hypothetical protein